VLPVAPNSAPLSLVPPLITFDCDCVLCFLSEVEILIKTWPLVYFRRSVRVYCVIVLKDVLGNGVGPVWDNTTFPNFYATLQWWQYTAVLLGHGTFTVRYYLIVFNQNWHFYTRCCTVMMYFVIICLFNFLLDKYNDDCVLCSRSYAVRSVWTAFENYFMWRNCVFLLHMYMSIICCILYVFLSAYLANEGAHNAEHRHK